jgi:hypothetical protein
MSFDHVHLFVGVYIPQYPADWKQSETEIVMEEIEDHVLGACGSGIDTFMEC